MKKTLLILAMVLAVAAPTFAWTPLTNRGFENGLTGWYVRDTIGDLPQATPLVPLSLHPDQTWLGTDAPWAQVFSGADRKMDISEGYFDGVTRRFRDSGNDKKLTIYPSAGSKACAWTRTGYKPLDNVGSGQVKDWAGWTWVSQYVHLNPGTYTATATCKWAADTPYSGQAGHKWDYSVSVCIMGDDPGFNTKWHPDWYGDDESTTEPPRHRDTLKPGSSWGTWQSSTALSGRTVKTQSGWIELRIGLHWCNSGFGSTSNPVDNITPLTSAEWGMIDDVYLRLVPEPSSIVALLTGLVGLGGLALRRRR